MLILAGLRYLILVLPIEGNLRMLLKLRNNLCCYRQHFITNCLLVLSLFFLTSCVSTISRPPAHELPDGSAPVNGRDELQDEINKILTAEAFENSTVGIKIVRLRDKAVLFEQNAGKLFHPASTMKLFTTAAALKHLGSDYRFGTSLAVLPGTIVNGVVAGNIFLIGTGDPSLTTGDLYEIAATLHSRGIREVTGDLICDETLFDSLYYGKGWMWDDQPYKDFAPISALSVNRNTIEFFVAPGLVKGDPAVVRYLPATNYIKVNNESKTIGNEFNGSNMDDPLTVLRRWQVPENIMDIRGTILLKSKERRYERNIVDSAIYTGTLLKEELRRAGIVISGDVILGEAPPTVEPVVTHESGQVSELIVTMNKMSHNLYAELMLKAVGGSLKERPGSAEKGLDVIMETITDWGGDPSSVRFADGSGVSRYGLVSSHSLTTLLEEVYDDFSIRHEFIASLPVAGVDGSLKYRQLGLSSQRIVHAKTGSMSGVSSLAGYAQSYDGETLAFAIMMEHFIGSAKSFREGQDQICDILCRFVDLE